MSAMLLALTLATPVPKPSVAPPPSLYVDGRVLVYSCNEILDGVPQGRSVSTTTHTRVKRTASGELFRWNCDIRSDGKAVLTLHLLATAADARYADENGQLQPGSPHFAVRPWWWRATTGDVHVWDDNGGSETRSVYDGTETLTVAAGTFTCARLRCETHHRPNGNVSRSTSWHCKTTGVCVRTDTTHANGSSRSELTKFTPGK